ncbi:MAG: metallopeptidase family protein [Dehalococcoidia bacterium]|nr:metallopeptidase family protein [Dehalococcoidia bacterium]
MVNRDRFRRLVQHALQEIPEPFARRLAGVAIVIRREPSAADRAGAGLDGRGDDLFGLYTGTPLTERLDYQMALPDRIVIFQGPHERAFRHNALPAEVRRTVMHEVAHHFGIDDARLAELGLD